MMTLLLSRSLERAHEYNSQVAVCHHLAEYVDGRVLAEPGQVMNGGNDAFWLAPCLLDTEGIQPARVV